MSKNPRPNAEAISPTQIAFFSIIGVLLIGALLGGGSLFLSHQRKQAEEQAYFAEQEKLREKLSPNVRN